jgi:hypothetical protein
LKKIRYSQPAKAKNLRSKYMRTANRAAIFIGPILTVLALSLSGCGGDFSYKRGAGMSDFDKEKSACADQHNDASEIEKCLNKNGWVMVGAGKRLVEETPLVEEPPETIVTPDGREVLVDITPVEITTNPLDQINISSWWKAGAGPAKLMADGDSCVAELGAAYKPQANFSIVTIGLQACMKDKGWFALEVK